MFSYLLIKGNTAKFKCMYLKTGVLLLSNMVREIDVTFSNRFVNKKSAALYFIAFGISPVLKF